jgi:hypothetical protein
LFLPGTTVNGLEEIIPGGTATVTQVTTVTEITVTLPETTENVPLDETMPSAEEVVLTTTTTEEVTKTITVTVQDEPSATNTDENLPTETPTDGMDTSE